MPTHYCLIITKKMIMIKVQLIKNNFGKQIIHILVDSIKNKILENLEGMVSITFRNFTKIIKNGTINKGSNKDKEEEKITNNK